MSGRLRALVLALTCLGAVLVGAAVAEAEPTLPAGFRDTTAIANLASPTAVRFAPDGEVFVAQKNGEILRFDDVADQTPAVFADLRKEVYDNGDRGLLGLAVDPAFPVRPYVYAFYTFDHVLGEGAPGSYPRWGQEDRDYEGDPCPQPGNAGVDACPVSGRLVRITAEAGQAGAQKVLVEDWCQQDSSHSVGGLQFGPAGELFASGGEGASFLEPDYGQFGWPHKNQCGDPPGGEALSPPSAEGGSLRSQDLFTPFNPLSPSDPTGLAGTLIRIDPDSGAGWPGNPLSSSLDANERRIVAYGFRNPFRFAIDPVSAEVYVNNVGNGSDEEIDRFPAAPGAPYNSGWPCLEGDHHNPEFENLHLGLCEDLYDDPQSTSEPFFDYSHWDGVVPDDPCPYQYGSAITGSAIYPGGSFPDSYDGALFFADSVRGCIYVMPAEGGQGPDPATARTFLADGGPYTGADVEIGPGGDLYYLSLYGDEALHRISYDPTVPIAKLSADKQWGDLPLKVKFDAGGSEDPGGEALSFAWDLDGNGSFETNGGATQAAEYKTAVNRTVAVRVESQNGNTGTAQMTVYPGDTPPAVTIAEPGAALTWRVGQQIEFSGSAIAQEGEGAPIPATGLSWRSTVLHCPGGDDDACHAHPLQSFNGTATGELTAPEHELPSRLRLVLTATDSRGLAATRTVELLPRTVALEAVSNPPGVTLSLGALTGSGPLSLSLIEGASATLTAPATAQIGGVTYSFESWSDGGPRVHSVLANGSVAYTATYAGPPGSPQPAAPAAGTGAPPSAPSRPLLSLHPPKRTGSAAARFEFESPAAGVGYGCKLDDGPLLPCRSPRLYRKLKPGEHVFRVYAEAPGESIEYSAATVFRWRVLAKRG